MRRRELREHIFKLLFMAEFNTTEEMPEQLRLYFEDMEELTQSDQQYMEQTYAAVREKLPVIDERLNKVSKGWKTGRMNKVDLSVLRLAVYELLFDEAIPEGVAINEAVEIAKKFGGEDSRSFVNGILGKIAEEENHA